MYERAHLLMRMSKNFLALLIAALISSAAPAQAIKIPPTFEFTGSGYGHGVGMSQIGARSRALTGESATAILNYYYKDVLVAPFVDTQTIRVNIAHLVKTISFTTLHPGLASMYLKEISEIQRNLCLLLPLPPKRRQPLQSQLCRKGRRSPCDGWGKIPSSQ